MKTIIKTICLGGIMLLGIACKSEQIYSPQEIEAMQQYGKELLTYMTSDTAGLHTAIAHFTPRNQDSVAFMIGDTCEAYFNHWASFSTMEYSTEETAFRPSEDIIDGVVVSANYKERKRYVYIGEDRYIYDGYHYHNVRISFYIDIQNGQPYVRKSFVMLNGSMGYGDNASIQLDQDVFELVCEPTDKDYAQLHCRLVFKRGVGLVALYDYQNGETWRLVE